MVTYQKARAALFARAASYINHQANENVDPEYTATWTWLQGSLQKRFGDDCKEKVELIFNPESDDIPDPEQNLGSTSSDKRTHKKSRETAPRPAATPTRSLPSKKTTRNEQRSQARAASYEDRPRQNKGSVPRPATLPRTKQMEERAQATIQATAQAAIQATVQATIQAIPTLIKQLEQDQAETQKGDNSGGGRQGRNHSQQPRDQAKYCQYCRQNGHGQLDCLKRKSDKAPCVNVRGESYYPANERSNHKTGRHTQTARSTEVRQGSDFHTWV